MVSEPDLFTALTLGVVVPLSATDAEVLKQRLNAQVIAVEAAVEKATTARRHVLAAGQLLDEEQAATKKLVPWSTSFSTTEITTASSSYVETIVANLHIQADTMMEEIHLDTSGPTATSMAFYSNKMMSSPLSSLLAPPHPPGKNNNSGPSNSNGRNNNRRNGGSGDKNHDNGGNHGGNTSRNTVVVSHGATTNDGWGPPPWPTSVNLSLGHIAMYPDLSPTS
jgi:hypothetical protein